MNFVVGIDPENLEKPENYGENVRRVCQLINLETMTKKKKKKIHTYTQSGVDKNWNRYNIKI